MVYINPAQLGTGLQFRRKCGHPNGFATSVFGMTYFGDDNKRSGIYQMRYRLNSTMPFSYNKKSCKIQVMMRHYWPTNPNSEAQQPGRTKFAEGMAAWVALSPDEKQAWTDRAKKRGTWGHSYFLSKYMLDQPLIS